MELVLPTRAPRRIELVKDVVADDARVGERLERALRRTRSARRRGALGHRGTAGRMVRRGFVEEGTLLVLALLRRHFVGLGAGRRALAVRARGEEKDEHDAEIGRAHV